MGLSIQCNDPETTLREAALLVQTCVDLEAEINQFNANLEATSVGRLGVANEKLVMALIESGGASLKETLEAAVEVIGGNPMTESFTAYYMATGSFHEKDPANNR